MRMFKTVPSTPPRQVLEQNFRFPRSRRRPGFFFLFFFLFKIAQQRPLYRYYVGLTRRASLHLPAEFWCTRAAVVVVAYSTYVRRMQTPARSSTILSHTSNFILRQSTSGSPADPVVVYARRQNRTPVRSDSRPTELNRRPL